MKEPQITISARIPESLGAQIDQLATVLDRNRSWIVEEALRAYIEDEIEFIKAVQEGLDAYEAGRVIPHEEVIARFERLKKQQSSP